MAVHRFAIGDLVRMKTTVGLPPDTADVYRVTGTMPAAERSFQYRIRNDEERHERVAKEENLEAAIATTTASVEPAVS